MLILNIIKFIPLNETHNGLLSRGPNDISNLGFIANISNIVTLK